MKCPSCGRDMFKLVDKKRDKRGRFALYVKWKRTRNSPRHSTMIRRCMMRFRDFLACGIVALIFALITIVVYKELGGKEALFLILGQVLAWGEFVVIFYFRKKPHDEQIN